MQQYIVLGIMAFMVISFILGKWSYGLVMMTCCTALAATGVLKISDAFSGFADKNLIMLAGVFVISNAFGKTGLISILQNKMLKMQTGKSAFVLMAIFLITIAVFAQFLPSTATMTVVIMLVNVLSSSGELCASRLLLPVAALATLWTSKIPIGMGATSFTRLNGFLEAYGDSYCIGMTDIFKSAIIPLIVLSLYTMFTYKLLPVREIDESKMKKLKEQKALPKGKENFTYAVFVIVMVCMFFNNILGSLIYIIPAIGAIVLVYAGCVSVDEAKKTLSGDILFMLAGAFVLTDALADTGAGTLIGNAILRILGGNPSMLLVMIVFAGVSLLMTNLMSNSATYNILIPLGISAAVAAGYDPRPVALVIASCSYCAILLPSSCGAVAIAYASANYSLRETLKFSLPFIALYWISAVVSIMIFF